MCHFSTAHSPTAVPRPHKKSQPPDSHWIRTTIPSRFSQRSVSSSIAHFFGTAITSDSAMDKTSIINENVSRHVQFPSWVSLSATSKKPIVPDETLKRNL